MMKLISLASVLILALSLSGCTKLSRITGSTNDTVLPGNREQIIPEDQKTAKDPIVDGQAQAQADDTIVEPVPATPVAPKVPCDPKKKICTKTAVTVQ